MHSSHGWISRNIIRPTSLVTFVSLLLVLLGAYSAPAAAHDGWKQADWYGVDDPRLEGPLALWHRVESVSGSHGDWWFTYGNASISGWMNRAIWDMGHRHGTQLVYAHVPDELRIQATVKYRIYKNNVLLATTTIHQEHNKDWQRLGQWEFNGAQVRIEVWDGETAEAYNRNNPDASLIGVDKISMKCTSNCRNDSLDPAGVSELYGRYQDLKREHLDYRNCVYAAAKDISNNLLTLFQAMSIEDDLFDGLTVIGLFDRFGIISSAQLAVSQLSNLTEALESIANDLWSTYFRSCRE